MASFFDPRINISEKIFELTEDESRHICRVLRMKEMDQLTLLDGKGRSYLCSIKTADPKRCLLNVHSFKEDPIPAYDLHLAVAPTKNMDRLEWFVEKATEIGVTEITCIQCHHSERIKVNEERIHKILVAAMKQSNRTFLPRYNGLTHFSDFIRSVKGGCIAYCGEAEKVSLETAFSLQHCPILIGPEGDFHPQEISMALNYGYQLITLGGFRLRTETAALAATIRASLVIQNAS